MKDTKQKVNKELDTIDMILAQCARELPDIDVSPIGPIGRLKCCTTLLEQLILPKFSQFDLSIWEVDMLSSLLCSGKPYCLTPTELFSALMVTSGTMTHRLKCLERKGYIKRLANKQDSRSKLVKLTNKGYILIKQVLAVHIENERKILNLLSPKDIAVLDTQLSKFLMALEKVNNI